MREQVPPEYRGWAGLVRFQRSKMVATETAKLRERLERLRAEDPGRYYGGDWSEVYDGLLFWESRDPRDEASWAAAVEEA